MDRGVEAPPLAAAVARATGAEQDRAGGLVCGTDLGLPGHPEILVTGDLMSLDKLRGVAEVAMQTGLYAGRRISHQARGHAFDSRSVARPGLGRLHPTRARGRIRGAPSWRPPGAAGHF